MAQDIAAGPSSSIIVDKQGMFWMAGKVKFCTFNTFQVLKIFFFSGKPVERVSLKGILIFHTNLCLLRFLGFALFIVQIHARYYVGTLQTSFKVQTVADVCFRGCKVLLARSGGVTHWLVTPDDDGTPMTICWGQTANNGLFLRLLD
jgi:hypothetical protein